MLVQIQTVLLAFRETRSRPIALTSYMTTMATANVESVMIALPTTCAFRT